MIELTRLNGECMVLNADKIERIESRPDTILSLTNGKKYIVRETVREVVEKLNDYRRSIFAPWMYDPSGSAHHDHLIQQLVS